MQTRGQGQGRFLIRLRVSALLIVASCGGDATPTSEAPAPTAEATATTTAEVSPSASAAPSAGPTDSPSATSSSPVAASPPPALPPIPAAAFDAADARAFAKASQDALVALLEHAAKQCPKKIPSPPGLLDVSPARGTVWDDEPRILEVSVTCNLAAGTGHANETFAPLRGSIGDPQHKGITPFGPLTGDVERNSVCPSAYSDNPAAVDIGLRKPLGGNNSVDVVVTVAIPKDGCFSEKERAAEKERRAHTLKVIEPFRAGITETMKKLEASCATAASTKPTASPAAGTALEKDKRVVDVEASCYLGRGNGSPVVTLPHLTGKRPKGSASFAFHGAARSGLTLETVNHFRKDEKTARPVIITFEKALAKGRVILEVSVDASSVPPPPKT